MTDRECALAILKYENSDRVPIVHFGFWSETVEKWVIEGHISGDEARDHDGVARLLGFDFDWFTTLMPTTGMDMLMPPFQTRVLETFPDGTRKVLDHNGAITIHKEGATGIPPEEGHLLTGREAWEEHFKPRLQYRVERIDAARLAQVSDESDRENPIGLYCGSLLGTIRNWLGLVGLSYLTVDDPDLLDEMVCTVADLNLSICEHYLANGAKVDFGHFWEDICFKNGPLVSPAFFREHVSHHYARFTSLLSKYGIELVSLDCDGMIDSLLPIWLENGVNTMFPIEVGTWEASIRPWREKYGRAVRGVGGMDKRVFAYDYEAIDDEIVRLSSLIELGGYIPCPDHRIPPDAKWDNVRYYCDGMRKRWGG